MSNISDLINSSGGKSFKFDGVGVTVTGTITSADVMQRRDFDTGEPEFWSDGNPIQQIRVTLDTDLRDPADPEDDGQRSVYVKGWGDQLRALRSAIKAAGASDLEEGGTFTATYARDGQVSAGKRGFPPKIFEYTYVKPSATASLVGDQQATQPAPQQPASEAPPAPAPQQTADPLAALTPEQRAAVQAMNAQQQSGS